ncbi:MAG TPA: hypothetical protein VF661_12190 [Actinomycetales bacterium]|jgi:tetratricopeptide (TPR) repeat protein
MNRRRLLGGSATVVGLTIAIFGVGAVAGATGPGDAPAPVTAQAAAPAEVLSNATITQSVAAAQERLRQYPNDATTWASLGMLYTQQARLTADPSYYGKADGAFTRSLEAQPADNAAALTGQATLAAARHDFGRALKLTQQADAINAYGATNLGVMADALGELGRYPESFDALQRMVDLKPGVPSYTRVSYSYELRGDTQGATYALTRALEVAQSPADAAFVLQYLGELAFNSGDLPTAGRHFAEGLERDPDYVPLLAGQARVKAASGKTEEALQDWQAVTTRLPEPTYLIEYADLLTALGRTDQARAQYAVVDATIRLFQSQGADVDLELARYDADNGRPQEALKAAGDEIARRQSIHVQDAYAWALHSAGRDREALGWARKAQSLGMENALFSYHRGMIENALGMKAQARASLSEALAINPHFSPLDAPKAQAALKALGGPLPS